MPPNEDKYVFNCPECGSRAFEVHGISTAEGAYVYCAKCRAEVGQLDEFMMIIETRTRDAEEGEK